MLAFLDPRKHMLAPTTDFAISCPLCFFPQLFHMTHPLGLSSIVTSLEQSTWATINPKYVHTVFYLELRYLLVSSLPSPPLNVNSSLKYGVMVIKTPETTVSLAAVTVLGTYYTATQRAAELTDRQNYVNLVCNSS